MDMCMSMRRTVADEPLYRPLYRLYLGIADEPELCIYTCVGMCMDMRTGHGGPGSLPTRYGYGLYSHGLYIGPGSLPTSPACLSAALCGECEEQLGTLVCIDCNRLVVSSPSP